MLLFCIEFFAVVFFVSCSSVPPDPSRVFSYRGQTLTSPKAKIFLVAGGADSANFAQEVLDQRKYWLSKGFKPEEISCYYVAPSPKGLESDSQQFAQLKSELSICFHADMKNIRSHLNIASLQKLPFIYLYFSAHGSKPSVLPRGQYFVRYPEATDTIDRTTLDETLNDYQITIDGSPNHPASLGKREGFSGEPRDYFLTPSFLAEILETFGRIPKIVVIQACHSGGFVSPAMKEIRNLTLMTAARSDRESFGCDPGDSVTHFGRVFEKLLDKYGKRPDRTDWHVIYRNLSKEIAEIEDFTKNAHSYPLFFSSAKAE
jgi:hypothetical protein